MRLLRMHGWQAVSVFALSLGVVGAGLGIPGSGPEAAAAPSRKSANLREMLESGLQARRPEEFQFLDRVVTMVDDGRLPQDLVRATFDWARDKRPYPYPFFERGLKLRAARLGITVR